LHIAANSVGLVTVEVGDKHRTLQLNRTIDRVKVAFVTSGQVRDTSSLRGAGRFDGSISATT
jgi:hypothetical protein